MQLFQNLMWLHPNFDLVFDLEMSIALSVNLWNLFSLYLGILQMQME
jgi:hypothetical protein